MLGPWFAAVAATGMVLGAMYLLYMTGKLCFGPLREPTDHHDHEELPKDLNLREIAAVAPIALVCLVFGLVPWPILHAVEPVAEEVLKPYPALVEAHVQRMEQMEVAESVAFSPVSTADVSSPDIVPAERSR